MIANKNIYFIHDDGTAELHCGAYRILIDGCEVDRVSKYQWSVGIHGYATSGCGDNQILMHRILANAKEGEIVDHINRNKLDNRHANLRICSRQQNVMNREKSLSGENPFKGVCRLKDGSWQAQIHFKHRSIYLGKFADVCDAAKAYDSAARELFGEFAYLNFPDYTEKKEIDIKRRRKLTANEVNSVRCLYNAGMTISELAKMYAHSYDAIYRLVRGRTFKGIKSNEKDLN